VTVGIIIGIIVVAVVVRVNRKVIGPHINSCR